MQRSTRAAIGRGASFTLLFILALVGCRNPFQVGLGDKVDLDVPDVSLTSHPAGAYLSGTVELGGVFTDDFDVASVTLSFDGGGSRNEATLDQSARTWSYTVDTTAFADGEREVLLAVTDGTGKSIEKRQLYFFDNSAPIVLVTGPQGYATDSYNGTITVRGEAADQFGLTGVEYRLLSAGGTPLTAWAAADGTNTWAFLFDSADFVADVGSLRVELRAVDRAGNTSTALLHYADVLGVTGGQQVTVEALRQILAGATLDVPITTAEARALLASDPAAFSFTINQSLDDPTFIITNPDEASPIESNVFSGSPRFTGTVDDDSEGVDPASIEYRIDALGGAPQVRDWTSVTSTVGSGLSVRWTADVAGLTDGDYELTVRASDTGSASGRSNAVPFRVDTGAPAVTVTSPAQGAYLNGAFTITGTATDSIGVESVSVSVDDGATWLPATLVGTSWSIEIDPTALGLADGPRTIKVEADDGQSAANFNLQVVIDREAPTVTFLTPAAGSDVNGTVEIRGTSSDNAIVSQVELKIGDDPGDPWIPMTGLYSWETTISSTDYEQSPRATEVSPGVWELTVYARVTDAAGNVFTRSDYSFRINNELDKPVVTFVSPTPGQRVGGTLLVSGTATDDDAVQSVRFQIDVNNDGDYDDQVDLNADSNTDGLYEDETVIITPSGTTLWTIDLNTGGELYAAGGGTGNVTMKAWAIDLNGIVGDEVERSVQFDESAPVIAVGDPAQGDYLNGTFTISGTATDPQGVTGVEVSVDDGATWTPASLSPAGGDVYDWSLVINPATTTPPLTDGPRTLRVRATDGNSTSELNVQIVLDRQMPTADFINPAPSSSVNGEVIIRGTSSDNNQVERVELRIGSSDPPIVLPDLYNWSYTIDSTSYASATHATETSPGSNVWRLDVEVDVTDVAGNVFTETGYFFFIDNDLDKPTVTFVAPSEGQRIAGPTIVTGTAVDDDAVQLVQMQLDVNNDGDFNDLVDLNGDMGTDDLYEDETTIYTLTGTTLWSTELNNGGELYTAAGGSGEVTIRVRARDINNVDGNWVQRTVQFDDTIPRAENVNRSSGDYVSGTFTLNADIVDDVQVRSVGISYNGGQNYTTLVDNNEAVSAGVTKISPNDFRLSIDVNTAATLPGLPGPIDSDILYLRLRITDEANYQSIEFINLNVDNQFPTGTWDSGAADPQEIDGTTALVQGTAADSGAVSGVSAVHVYFVRGSLVYNPSTGATTTVGSADFDDGAGSIVSVPYPTTSAYRIQIDDANEFGADLSGNGDGDGFNESITISGATYNWFAQFNSTVIPDGTVDIHYVIFDNAGNGTHYLEPGFIKNNRPVISSLTVGTDLDFSGAVEADERFTYASSFSARGRLYVRVNASDPGGGIASTEIRRQGDDSLVASSPPGGNFGTGAEIDLSGESEGATLGLYALVTDTVGITARQNFAVVIDNDDGVNPSIVVDPLTVASVVDGHVEASGQSTFDNGSGADADASGTVAITGALSDDQRIQSVFITIEGFDAGSGAGVQHQVAGWDAGAGELQSLVGAFSILSQTLDPVNGHEVDFSYEWNTAGITNQVGRDVAVLVQAEDFGVATATAAGGYNVDVVPYIESVSTDLTGIRDRNIRSAQGAYVVGQSDSAIDTITISGFNLNPITAGVRVSSDPDGLVGTTLQGDPLTIEAVAGDFASVTVRKNATGSGWLSVVSGTPGNPIASINNVNDNALAQNQEPSVGQNNPTLRDDRYLSLFSVIDTGFVNGYYPEMLMDGDFPVFGFIDDSAASDLQFTRGEVTGESGGVATVNRIGLIRGLGFQYYALARDDDGIYHQLSSSSFNSESQYYIYGEYAPDYPGNWGTGYNDNGGATRVYFTGFTGNRAPSDNNDVILMDALDYDPGLLVGRYRNPRLIASGRTTLPGTAATIAMSFYDSGAGSIIFRNFQTGETPAGGIVQTMNDTAGVNLTGADQQFELGDQTSGDTTRNTVTSSASQFFDMGRTDAGVVVIAYYDESTGRLNLTYSDNGAGTPTAVDGSDPDGGVTFATPFAVPDTFIGSYVSMHVQTDGNAGTPDPIHIAAHDSAGADLAYIRFSSITDTTPSVVTVDANLSVGIWTDINVSPTGVPYIGYYNSSETGTRDSVKLAWFLGDAATAVTAGVDAGGAVTGNWEFVTIPANNVPNGGIAQFIRVSVDFDTSGNPVVGFLADDIEYARAIAPLP